MGALGVALTLLLSNMASTSFVIITNKSSHTLRVKSTHEEMEHFYNIMPDCCIMVPPNEKQVWNVHARYDEHGLSKVHSGPFVGDKTFEQKEVELAIASTKRYLANKNAAPAADVSGLMRELSLARAKAIDAVNKQADIAKERIEEAARKASKSLGLDEGTKKEFSIQLPDDTEDDTDSELSEI